MNQNQYNQLFSFIWNIANDVLVNAFNKGDYKKIILPMMVLRRLDILLEPTHDDVIKQKSVLDGLNIPQEAQECQLFAITKHPFCNTSRFTMKSLRGNNSPRGLVRDFKEYLDGFSSDVQDIIEKFKFKQQVDNLADADRLGLIINKFTDETINLGIHPIKDKNGNVVLEGVDNHTMGTLFEQLLRKFNEENSVTEAGEHFTPRDYVSLLAELAISPIANNLKNSTYTVYDGACGTGGILSVAEQRMIELAEEHGKKVKINLYGQELQPETYATCKADLMLSSVSKAFKYNHAGRERQTFYCGSTISDDGHAGMKFDFCISNPPFGTPWKPDMEAWGLDPNKDKDKVADPRFYEKKGYMRGASFVPNIGDPQMLFLANNVSRMKADTELGTRIVEVHNGSSLFTGNAGGGESNLRRYIIENDLLEVIIAMPENEFYNTGISTYIWVLSNRKSATRRGKVQLIDATSIKTPLRKNLGNKNCETTLDDREAIMKLYNDFVENEKSRIFPNKEFGYWNITVERPWRLVYKDLDKIDFSEVKSQTDRSLLEKVVDAWKKYLGGHTVGDYALFVMLDQYKIKVTATQVTKVRKYLGMRDEKAEPCRHLPTKLDSSLEPDPDLRDIEQVPLLYEGGIEAFMQNEVLPYAPDAYVDETKTEVGYELSFTKYFYKPTQLRSLEDIEADIRSIERDTDGLLNEILTR
jgi:type I restriction enzyme M protein